MAGLFDNIHLGLKRDDAIAILTKQVVDLESASDFYMACSHLINFPCDETEEALILFLSRSSADNAVRLAQRKAIEVLARLKSNRAQLIIAGFLESSDSYTVENAAWALGELNCSDRLIHESMISLLSDPSQNQRVLIQSLAKLSVSSAIPSIECLLASEKTPIRGAALAALSRLSGEQPNLDDLSDYLYEANQMDRQSAVQDIIDADAFQILPDLLTAPISPAFRMRALRSLVKQSDNLERKQFGLEAIQKVLLDDPRDIIVVHRYDMSPSTSLLVESLFHPDFSRCYLAMQSLLSRDVEELYPLIEDCWNSRAYNDYGAHYFLMRLFGLMEGWSVEALNLIKPILRQAIADKRPQFKKSAPAAFLSYARLFPNDCHDLIEQWLGVEGEQSWDYRYVALMVIQSDPKRFEIQQFYEPIKQLSCTDPDWAVRYKTESILGTV